MFNLVIGWFEEFDGTASMPLDRMFQYTADNLADQFRENNLPQLDQLTRLPCLFMSEGTGDEVCRIGHILRARIANGQVHFDYVLDVDVPQMVNQTIHEHRNRLDMPHLFEFTRTHWAVKDIDLYRFLYSNILPRRQRPSVFQISEREEIQVGLLSAMMPFSAEFAEVHQSIRAAAEGAGMRCQRADDIWENATVIQDVVALIDRSQIVVCDCTGRNPNVFYEAGIAHTLGREVILITQNEHDIPFDLRHLRYIRYLNNAEGRTMLTENIGARIATIQGAR